MGKYGHYSADGLEYVITTPHTPRDWFNFFWNPTYLASAGQSMNGSSLYQNEEGVVTNLFGKQDMREDPRWLYIRDNDTGEFWSAGFLPCFTEHDEFECRHGLGYTVLSTLKNGIRVEFRMFVPRKYAGELWTVTVTNESKGKEKEKEKGSGTSPSLPWPRSCSTASTCPTGTSADWTPSSCPSRTTCSSATARTPWSRRSTGPSCTATSRSTAGTSRRTTSSASTATTPVRSESSRANSATAWPAPSTWSGPCSRTCAWPPGSPSGSTSFSAWSSTRWKPTR
ncbi:MAG: hypothetical protein GWP05_06770 [Anaerolineaceae bacterium]|nr:hypothetical protein [Anaerolineaceae bacterium]